MTQPPGPHGYGPPPAYGPPGYPPPPPPQRPSPLPWVLLALVVVLVAGGLTAFFVLRERGEGPVPAAASGAPTSTASSAPAPTRSSTPAPAPTTRAADPAGGLAGGATTGSGAMDPASEPDPAAGGRFTGSADIAYSWVQRMAGGDFQGAYDLCDPALQSGADSAAAADGSAPADALAAYFYTHTLGGDFFTDATFQGVEHDDGNGLDVATFTLQMSSGDPVTLLVYVDGDLQVTDFL